MTVDSTAARAGGISRRRVMKGAAWATPAILIATASPHAAASTTRALDGVLIIERGERGNENHFPVVVKLPDGIGATAVTLMIEWTPAKSNSSVGISDWSLLGGSSDSTSPSTFTIASLDAGATFTVDFFKASRVADGSDFRLTLSGIPTGATESESVVLPGEFADFA